MKIVKLGLAVFGVAVAAGVLVFGVLGVGESSAAPGPGGGGGRGIFAKYDEVLAQKLGISLTQLQTAQKAARDQLIDDAVAAGQLTKAQGDALKSGQHPGGNQGPGGAQGRLGPAALRDGIGDAIKAAATSLKMTPEELRTALRSGQSLAEIAQSKGVAREALRASIMASVQNDVNTAIRDGKITAPQGTTIIDGVSRGLDRLIDQRVPRLGQNRPSGGAPGQR